MGKLVRKVSTAAMALIMVCISVMLLYTPAQADDGIVDVWIEVEYQQSSAREMLNFINLFRTGHDVNGQQPDYWNEDDQTKTLMTDLQTLAYDYSLERTAMLRAAEIATKFSHSRPNGDNGPWNAWDDSTCFWYAQGENLAGNSSNSARTAFVQLREDDYKYAGQGHRRNMLSADFNRVGIGHVFYNGIHYWVKTFGYGDGDDAGTQPVNATHLVSVKVQESLVTQSSVTTPSAIDSLEIGENTALPDVPVSFRFEDTWPKTKMASGIVKPAWTSSDTSIAKIEGTDIVGVSAGSTTITATVFGTQISVPVTVTPAVPEFKGHRLVLSGEIGVQFAMDLSCLSAEELAASSMSFTLGGVTIATESTNSAEILDDGRYLFTCYVNSLQMADEITATFQYGAGQTVVNNYSVKEYITYIVEHSDSFDASTVVLAKATADYGYFSQIYLADLHGFTVGDDGKYAEMTGYKSASELDTAGAASAVAGYSSSLDKGSSGIERFQLRLSLDTETALSIRAKMPSGETIDSGIAKIHGENYPFDSASSVAKVTGIKAAWLGDPVSVSGNAGGTFGGTASALSYVDAVLNGNSTSTVQVNAMAALYNYYAAGKAYQEAHAN